METFNSKLQELMKREKHMPAVTRIGDADVAHCSGMTRLLVRLMFCKWDWYQ